MVAVIVRHYGVTLTKGRDGGYGRIVDLLYEAMNIKERPTSRTLKRPLDAVISGRYTWCDYEVGEVRIRQSWRDIETRPRPWESARDRRPPTSLMP